jgi:hypothetical protein
VPGNIRKAEHFVSFLKKIVEYFKKRLKGTSVEKVSRGPDLISLLLLSFPLGISRGLHA